jgi:FkbM family methyltransferase
VDFVSYAQNFEDVMLWRALQHVGSGIYIDIGAQDPVSDSVSRGFYLQGWRGVHVEPCQSYAMALRQDRPDETVLEVAVGQDPGLMEFYEFPGTGLSTAVAETMAAHQTAGWTSRKTLVPVVTLDSILAQIAAPEVHWLKIDVEGFESEVLAGWTSTTRLPWIVVVEALIANQRIVSAEWEPLLTVKGYECVYFDGLNRYYISPQHPELAEHFQYGPCLWDAFQLPDVARPVRILKQDFTQQVSEISTDRDRLGLSLAEETTKYLAAAREAEGLQTRLAVSEARHEASASDVRRLEGERSALLERLAEAETSALKAQAVAFSEAATLRTTVEAETALRTQLEQRLDLMAADLRFVHLTLNAEREERDALRLKISAANVAWRRRYLKVATTLERIVGSRWWRLHDLFRPPETWLAATAADIALDREPEPVADHVLPARSLSELLSHRGDDLIEVAFATLLNRAPDEAGRSHFTGRIALGSSPESIVAEIRNSPEGVLHGADLPGLDLLLANDRRRRSRRLRALDALTGRAPGPIRPFAGLPSPHLLARCPTPPAASVDQLFRLSDTAFVQCAYVSILGREADPDGFSEHVTRLQAGEDRLTQIAALRWSREGVAYGSTLTGLDRATRWWSVRHIPPLARLLKALAQVRGASSRLADRLADFDARLDTIAESVLAAGSAAAAPVAPSPEDGPMLQPVEVPPPPVPGLPDHAPPPAPTPPRPIPRLKWAHAGANPAGPLEHGLWSALTGAGHQVLAGGAGSDVRLTWSRDPLCPKAEGEPSLLVGAEPVEGVLSAAEITQMNDSWTGVGCLTRLGAKALLDHGAALPVVAIGVGLDGWDKVDPAGLEEMPRHTFRYLHCVDRETLAECAALLDAFGDLFRRGDDVALVLSSTNDCREAVSGLVETHRRRHPDPATVVTCFGPVDDARLKALVQACTVLVDPCVRREFPYTLARALQSGRPAIAVAYGAARDLCDAQSAWLIDYQFIESQRVSDTAPVVDAEILPGALRDSLWRAYRAAAAELADRGAAGQRHMAQRFSWAATARRVIDLAQLARAVPPPGTRAPRLGVVTTWNVQCGIAAASAELLAQTPTDDVTIFAARQHPQIAVDGPNCVRAWDPGKTHNRLDEVRDHIVRRKIEGVIIQFNYGFFNHQELDTFIRSLTDLGVIVFVILHSTTDPLGDVENYRLKDMSAGFSACDRLICHSVADLNRLKRVSRSDNLLLSPLGVGTPTTPRYHLADPQRPLLASFGFCFENKGLLELVETVALLKSRGQPVRLIMLNAVHPDPSSARMADRVTAAIAARGLGQDIRFVREFLDIDEVIRRISDADVIINPYQVTGESASAAIRTGMRANRLTVVTPLPIFDELGPAVIRTPGTTPAEMANGVLRAVELLRSQSDELKSLEAAAQAWLHFNAYERQGQRLTTMIRSLNRTKPAFTHSGSETP